MKKIGLLLAASMFFCSFNMINPAYADSTGQETFGVVNYYYDTKTQETEVLVRSDIESDINTKARELGIGSVDISAGYNPGLPVDTESTQENGSRTIINADSQSYVNPNNYPYSAVLMIRLGQDTNDNDIVDSWTRGTAFLEGHIVAATAAHNIWSHTSDYGWIEECRIYVRQNSSTLNSTYYEPASWIVPTAFISNEDPNNDWAVLVLNDNLGSANGWFGKGKGSTVDLEGTAVAISGYPGETTSKYGKQYCDSNAIADDFDENRLKYLIDTEAGQSGSPIYDSSYVAWGIHTLGGTSYNYGIQICDWMYDLLQTHYLRGVSLYGSS